MSLFSIRSDHTITGLSAYSLEEPPLEQKELESWMLSDQPAAFLDYVNRFIDNGGNPNKTFSRIAVIENSYREVTCFQLVYLYWKCPEASWDAGINARFEELIDQMLNDERTDVGAKFTEDSLFESEHFVSSELAKYQDDREEEGYLIERATIAHYAVTVGDFEMVDKILQKDPGMIHSTCCLMKGKNLLHNAMVFIPDVLDDEKPGMDWTYQADRALEAALVLDSDEVAGHIGGASIYKEGPLFSVTRITKVSLLHLAARCGDEGICLPLRSFKADLFARDSDNLTSFDYLKLSVSEGFTSKPSDRLRKALEPIERIYRPLLPNYGKLLIREGYWLMYDTRTKVAIYAYKRLTKESLEKNSERADGGSFKVDREVPELNRGTRSDYTKSGFDKGHLVPAGDAISSQKAMEDTFLYTNAAPQDRGFNRGYWKRFEGHIRKLVDSHDLIEVFTGCLFLSHDNQVTYQTIGAGETSVPTHFFKVLYFYKGLEKLTKAYIMPNEPIDAKTPYQKFSRTVDDVQRLSGILFSEWRPT